METKRKNPSLPVIKVYFSLLMILVYIAAGFSVLMLPDVLTSLSPIHKLPLGLTLVVYGIYRFIKWVRLISHYHE